MPIRVQNDLPVKEILESENIFVMDEHRAMHQDIRPLNVLILNLMPTKIITETQLLRKLSNTPLQICVDFLQTASYTSTHTDPEHLKQFYYTFDQIKDRRYDGMIITGAPLDYVPYEETAYWDEVCKIMEWTKTHVHCTFHLCWGAYAGLYYHYGVQKHLLPTKKFGIFRQKVMNPTLASVPRFRRHVQYAAQSPYRGARGGDTHTLGIGHRSRVGGEWNEHRICAQRQTDIHNRTHGV